MSSMSGRVVAQQTLALALAALAFGVLAAPPPPHSGDGPHVVSLEDVTGVTPHPPLSVAGVLTGVSEVGYPDVPPPPPPRRRPSQSGGVVSLEDVTGLSPGQSAAGANLLDGPGAYVRPAYVPSHAPAFLPPPRYGGVVSLEDVAGPQRLQDGGSTDVLHLLHQADRPHPHYPPQPLHPERGYDPRRPYSPCYVPGTPAYTLPSAPSAYALHSRTRRSPSPRPGGVVALEDVAGPAAAHYPAFGPPAYVRPAAYNYYNGYDRPYGGRPYGRPYNYNGYYNNYNIVPVPVACIGLFCL